MTTDRLTHLIYHPGDASPEEVAALAATVQVHREVLRALDGHEIGPGDVRLDPWARAVEAGCSAVDADKSHADTLRW